MKKILYTALLFVLILFLTRLANEAQLTSTTGTTFSLKSQRVISCTPDQIVLAGTLQQATRLEKDTSWPACSVFANADRLDFYLSRGAQTHFIRYEKTAWWRQFLG